MTISDKVTWKTLGEKVVAVKVDTGEYYTMNEVASIIWIALSEGCSNEMIADRIMDSFDNDYKDSVLKDIEEQISEWKKELLIN